MQTQFGLIAVVVFGKSRQTGVTEGVITFSGTEVGERNFMKISQESMERSNPPSAFVWEIEMSVSASSGFDGPLFTAMLYGILSAGILLLGLLRCVADYTGATQRRACKDAEEYLGIMALQAKVSCAGGRNDSYVDCTILLQDGQPIAIQCAALFTFVAPGCRLTPAITQPQRF